jgi:hypothetical protein
MEDTAHRLRTLWDKGRNQYSSFFAILEGVRKEIGDSALPIYCRDELGINFGLVEKAKGFLKKDDEIAVRTGLILAKRAEKERKALEKEQKKKEAKLRLIDKYQRAIERAEEQKKATQLRLDLLQDSSSPVFKIVE